MPGTFDAGYLAGTERRLEDMGYRIRVPLNSPACESYIRDGWTQTHIDGQWATLQMHPLEVYDATEEQFGRQTDGGIEPEQPADH